MTRAARPSPAPTPVPTVPMHRVPQLLCHTQELPRTDGTHASVWPIPGGGFPAVPALVTVPAVPMSAAVGTSPVVAMANALVVLAARGPAFSGVTIICGLAAAPARLPHNRPTGDDIPFTETPARLEGREA